MSASRTFVKQPSLDASLPLGINGDEASDSSPRQPLNRSMTVSGGRRSSGVHESKRERDWSSPLKRFSRAKDAISRTYGLIRDRLSDAQAYMKLAHSDSPESPSIGNLLGRTEGIQEILSRDHMKVAFFGRTSNGKSSVINALLGDKILPTGIGHTTNCFLSVIGADSNEGYLIKPGSKERQDIKNLKQLAHSLHKEHLESSSLVEVFWPKSKCSLLKDDVELVDSPGIDMNPNMDEWIDKHCLNADVFVLVSNAESTLMRAEKKFFHRVSERLSKPNIFILNNRWDCSAQEEPEMMAQVQEQHLENDIGFLAKELNVVNEKTAKERVFFVSASEVLTVRQQEKKGKEIGKGLASGWNVRRTEFENFERSFKQCISSAAIRIKFEQHHTRGSEVVEELEQIMFKEEADAIHNRQLVSDQLQLCNQRKTDLKTQSSTIRERCRQQITVAVSNVEKKITIIMRDIQRHLRSLVDEYKAPPFDPKDTTNYKNGLYKFVDERLAAELSKVGSTALVQLHNEAQTLLIGHYQELMKLPEDELSRFYQLVRAPELSYILKCEDLCEDFKEDLAFHFSLGLGPVMRSTYVKSWLGSVQSQLSHFWSIIPMEYAAIGVLLVGGLMVPRILNWRYLLPSVGIYGALYSYEYLSWNSRSQEQSLKDQFVDLMRSKLNTQIVATSNSYVGQMTNNLNLLLDSLHAKLESTHQDVNNNIVKLTQEQMQYTHLQEKAKKLRNAVRLLKQDLENFKEDYLNDKDTFDST